MTLTRIALTVLLLLSAPAVAGAQEKTKPEAFREMDVDLPDETEETSLVDPGEYQLESAVLYNRYGTGQTSLIGQLMIRYGVSKRLELRALLEDGHRRDRYLEETVQSTYPLAASAKFVLLKDHNILPDITLVGYLKLPFTGRSSDQNAYWSPIVLAAFQHKWGQERWKLEYNAGIQQESFSREWVWLGNASIHYKVIQPVEVFAEYYAQYQSGEDPQHNIGGGVAWQIGNHIEVYSAIGTSVDYVNYNLFVTAGIAGRF